MYVIRIQHHILLLLNYLFPNNSIECIPYSIPNHKIINGVSFIDFNNKLYRLKIFGKHNLQNIAGAHLVCNLIGVKSEDFYNALASFNGASNRLELIYKTSDSVIYKDFAHSPSKVKATTNAVKEQFNNKRLIACFELHTYSSLNPIFLKKYENTLDSADECVIYYSEKNMKIKRLKPIDSNLISKSFNHRNLVVVDDHKKFEDKVLSFDLSNTALLMMSSGKFGGFDLDKLKSL